MYNVHIKCWIGMLIAPSTSINESVHSKVVRSYCIWHLAKALCWKSWNFSSRFFFFFILSNYKLNTMYEYKPSSVAYWIISDYTFFSCIYTWYQFSLSFLLTSSLLFHTISFSFVCYSSCSLNNIFHSVHFFFFALPNLRLLTEGINEE